MKNQLESAEPVVKAGYKGVKVTGMLKALQHSEIHRHLRLVQQDEVARIKNFYNKVGYIRTNQMQYIWELFYNFVLRDFRYADKRDYKTEKQTFSVKVYT